MLKLMALCLLSSFCLFGEIYEMEKMQDLYQHLTKDSLLVFDIDNTIMEPEQEVGNDQWFRQTIKDYINEGFSPEEAFNRTYTDWSSIQHVTKMVLVEDITRGIIRDLQEKKYPVMALTTRDYSICHRTGVQLSRLDIDMLKSSPSEEEFFYKNPRGVLFTNGILFTSGTDKGEAFRKFLKRISYMPKEVIFINDKLTHVKSLEKYCEAAKIPFKGLRYSYLDKKVASYNHSIAKHQMENFGTILTNEEAQRALELEEMIAEEEDVANFLEDFSCIE